MNRMGSLDPKQVRGPAAPGGAKGDAVRVWLLGGFRVTVGSRPIAEDEWRLKKAAALVKLLALAPAHIQHREQIMNVLWPHLSMKAASNNLRQALYAARRILAPDPSVGSWYLGADADSLVLCPKGDLWVDVEGFEAAALSARRIREPDAYEAAIELYVGELLPEDRYEEWAEDRRGELDETHVSLFLGLASVHEEREDHGSAIEVLRTLTRKESTNEEAHAGLMRLYALSGRKADALRQYEFFEGIVSRELGTGPSASTRALKEEIASGRFPPEMARPLTPGSRGLSLEVSQPPQHNLPVPRTSFVGRQYELPKVKQTLAMTRLLTLTGAGGSGKTRLALEVATGLVAIYADGVWLAELAGFSEPELAPQAVASVLGVREQPGQTLVGALANHLNERKLLLLLDNCEHVVDAVAHLVDFLLGSCSHLRVLTTSREPLGVEGEVLFPVPSLSVPTGSPKSASEIGAHDSVRLFAERTRVRLPDFVLTEENAPAVSEVCRRLEGIPLAIELAAARMGTLATEQVAERLEDSLGLLSAGPRTASPRHRTIRDTIGWSYGLLSEREREAFDRLAVFAGGFTLEAAEAVCPGGRITQGEVLDLLSHLVDKSLVAAEASMAGRVRYHMLEPVRQYTLERLHRSDEAETAHRRHAVYFFGLADRAAPELRGPGQVEWLERLEADNDNLRAAMAWLQENDEVETAVRMAWALWIFWLMHAHMDEGRRWIEAALAKGENLTVQERGRALWVQASTYYGKGTPEQIERMCEEAASLFRQVGDKPGLAHPIAGLASAAMQRGDLRRATALFKESLELAREVDDKWGVSSVLGHLGSISLAQGDFEQATRYLEEGLSLSNEIGNKLSVSTTLYNLALAAQGQGNYERAEELYAEGLRSSAVTGDKANIAYCIEGLAQVAAVQEKMERAARLFGAAEAALEAAGGAVYVYVQDRSVHDQMVDTVHSRMDEVLFSSAWSEGSTMPSGEAVEYALRGEVPGPPPSNPVTNQLPPGKRPVALTRRELEIALRIAHGLTNRQIAVELSKSEHTVASHVGKILRKLRLNSRAQITAWVMEQGTPSRGRG